METNQDLGKLEFFDGRAKGRQAFGIFHLRFCVMGGSFREKNGCKLVFLAGPKYVLW